MEVTEFIECTEYQDFVNDLDKRLPIKIDFTYRTEPIVFEMFAEHLLYANATCEDLLYIVKNSREAALRYIIYKDAEMSKEPLEEGVVEVHPPTVIFPIGALIEFYIFEQKGDINDYMKKMRMPGARKFIKQITEIFNTAVAETKELGNDA